MLERLISLSLESNLLAQTVTTTTVTQGRNYVYDAILTVFLIGITLFVICKASNRT